MKRYLKYWYLLTINSFSSMLVSRLGGFLFILGKVLRFIFFLNFLLLITQKRGLIGYSVSQAVFFYLTFNLVDTLSQLFFREVYRFRALVVTGNLDYVLTKPISPLFRSLMGGADIFDLFMLIPFTIIVFLVGSSLKPTWVEVISYIVLLISGVGIAASIHIFVLALGILTTEIDHAIMIYRDIASTGRVPIDIYRQPIRGFLTFIIPVAIMTTLPAKALFGLVSPLGVVAAIALGIFFLFLSLKFWKYALSQYSSASS